MKQDPASTEGSERFDHISKAAAKTCFCRYSLKMQVKLNHSLESVASRKKENCESSTVESDRNDSFIQLIHFYCCEWTL